MTTNDQAPVFDATLPIALFPVRLETRLVPDGTKRQLWVRIYPDGALLANAHDRQLSAAEQLATNEYQTAFAAAASEVERAALFAKLCDRFGEPRGSYLASRAKADPIGGAVRAWKPPTPQLMPDRWLGIAYHSGTRLAAWSNDVDHTIALGPAGAPVADATSVKLDPRSAWLTDWGEAVRVGMALMIDLPDSKPVERLVVIGLSEAASSKTRVEDWLEAQHYAQGFELLPQGAATRNLEDQPTSYRSRGGDHALAYAAQRAPQFTQGDGSDGDVLARALGVKPDLLARMVGANRFEQQDARQMIEALWPATLGYTLKQMMQPLVADDQIEWARTHTSQYVRARGPLPAFRVGPHAHGFLPVVSLSEWKPTAPETNEQSLWNLVTHAKTAFWDPAIGNSPFVGKTPDAERDLLQVLRQAPTSVAYGFTSLRGLGFLQLLQQIIQVDWILANWQNVRSKLSDAVLRKLGVMTGSPKLADLVAGEDAARTIQLPRVSGVLTEIPPAQPDSMLTWLRTATYADLRDEKFTGDKGSLLYKLLRHSVMLGYVTSAQTILALPLPAILEHELVKLDAQYPGLIPSELLAKPVPTSPNEFTGDFLHKIMLKQATPPFDNPAARTFLAMRDALAGLAKLPSASLDRLLAETLDLSMYRLDAWITSLATKRLADLRKVKPLDLRIGAYGWVENLAVAPDLPVPEIVQDEPGVRVDAANAGYILAPSIAQATTAAVMRSGQLSHDEAVPVNAGAMTFDLSAARVRSAYEILDGMRNGQPLAALLGYRFERALHEHGLDQWIAPLRRRFPLVAQKRVETVAPGAPADAVAATNVVDGVALHLGRSSLTFDNATLPAAGSPAVAPTNAALDLLDDAYAAVSDVLVTEGLHQAVAGNHARSIAALDTISLGDNIPASLEALRTPRTGIGVSHRLCVLLPTVSTSSWPQNDRQVRRLVEPRLDAWVGQLLGDPARVICSVQPRDESGAPVGEPVTVKLSQLGLSPLDLLAAAEAGDRGIARQAIALATAGVAHAVAGTLEPDGAVDANHLEVATFLAHARSIAAALAHARPLTEADLVAAGAKAAPSLVGLEAQTRAKLAEGALQTLAEALATSVDSELSAALARAAQLGFADTIGLDKTQRAARAASIRATVANRQQAIAKLAVPSPTDSAAVASYAAAVVDTAFGSAQWLVPQLVPVNASELAKAIADLAPMGRQPIATWFERVAAVRTPIDDLARALTYSDALAGAVVAQTALQLPSVAGAPWIGGELPVGTEVQAGTTSFVLLGAPPSAGGSWCGLMIDEWHEILPSSTETGGVAFHFDDPTNRAPHAVLLAVPPQMGVNWTYAMVERTVISALELAKLRAVDPNAIADTSAERVGQYIPGLFLAQNAANEAVSTAFESSEPT